MQPTDTTRAHCVDPETLAAWVDGGLAAPAAAEVEAHLSTCARCQAVLAAFSATEPSSSAIAPAVVLPFWSRRQVQWAAAALVAAASLTLWTMTQRPQPDATPTLAAPDNVVVQAPSTPSTTPAPSISAPAELRRTSPPAPARRPASKPAAAKSVVVPPAPAPAPPPAPAPVASPPPAPTFTTVNAPTAATGARLDQTTFRPMAEIATAARVFEVISVSDQNAPLAADALMPRGGGRGGAAGGGAGNSVSTALARRPQVRWRVAAATVERSIDSGRTWERLDLDPPFVLTAGSAPYQNVCWLIGRDGVVFRTTNGTSFERMTPPARVDLLAIVATDALNAMVTAADGRIFDTADGGVTWRARVPRG